MAEEEQPTTAETNEAISADDWAAAMAEQVPAVPTAEPAAFQELSGQSSVLHAPVDPVKLDLIKDIPMNLTVELGRAKIAIRNLLQLSQGSVIELDGMAGEPMSVLVNGFLIAQGEVVVVNEKFGIRLTDIINPEERLRRLSRN